MNAKEELLRYAANQIKCAYICCNGNESNLRVGHTPEELDEFLNSLDYEYDNGFGNQELFGTVWLTEEGSWLDRVEYDGSEGWTYQRCPRIPEYLQ